MQYESPYPIETRWHWIRIKNYFKRAAERKETQNGSYKPLNTERTAQHENL